MILGILGKKLFMNFSWLSETLALLSSWGSGTGFVCCSRSATAQLIVRQRGLASELTNSIPAAISATDSLERTMSTHLPPGDNLCTTLSSPQFSQALSMFWSALQSGQAAPVIRQFGLGPDAVNAAASGNLEEFVSALESEAKSGQGSGGQQQQGGAQPQQQQQADDDKSKKQSPSRGAAGGTPGKKDDDDEGMALD